VVHLRGSNDGASGQVQHPAYVDLAFSHDMAGLLQHVDLVISRAGAGSLSELAVGGTPAILVPFPAAADGHQEANAAAAAAVGAAVIVLQHPPGEPPLERAIWRLLGPRLRRVEAGGEPAGGGRSLDPLLELRQGMGRLAQRDADRHLAQLLQGLVRARD
jgi:UDP-N-acetylglucosamine--N-acetylmuramyl-(pentapeptide) pyrophosphoryl-undecaprenol N-acetylglucosamine transferase